MKEYIEKYIENTGGSQEMAYKSYLENTDYIVTKIAETQALGEDIKPLLEEYKNIIENRIEAREMINKLNIKE